MYKLDTNKCINIIKVLKDRNCLIDPLDVLIGAHAKSLNLTLVTNNTIEFERIK